MSNDDEKILKMLEDLQSDIKGLRGEAAGIKTDVAALRDGQKSLEAGQNALQDGQKALEAGQQALELKVEAIHAYQKQAHDEIMGHVIDIAEVGGHDHKALVKRVERIEKHLDLPPLK
jgi:chromosome segregation ATPase